MQKIFYHFLTICLFLGISTASQASDQDSSKLISTENVEKIQVDSHENSTHAEASEKFNPTDLVIHHVSDANEWHLFDYTNAAGEEVPVSIPLPVILLTDGNLDVFMSSAFHHGHSTVVKGDREYAMQDGHIVRLNVPEEESHNFIDFSITKVAASLIFVSLLILLIFSSVARAYKKRGINSAPKGIQSLVEPIIEFIRDDIAKPNVGAKYEKFMPYLLTIFFFIWINNLMGLIPIFPGGANVTGNIAVTMVLAAFTMLATNLNAKKAYWKHIFASPGVPIWLSPIMIPVELIGVISKPFALMIRLFANITAGHIVILSLTSLIFIFKSLWIAPVSVAFVLFMSVLELLVAVLQAYIFTLLSALFIGLAVADDHH